MPQLTQRELLYLKDALDMENLMVEKFGTCAESTTDPEVRRVCEDIQATHRAHQQTLKQVLSGATGSGRMH